MGSFVRFSANIFWTLLTAAVVGAQPPAPPSVTQDGVRNAANRIPPGLPGGAIAPGSLIAIEGVRLAGPKLDLRIESDGPAVRLAPLRVSDDRILAVVPPDAPIGDARLIVAHSGQQSLPYPLRIVDGSFGIFNITASDESPEFGDFSGPRMHAAITPARPGQTLTIWGTGLGKTQPEVFVADLPARVLTAKHQECCAGIEAIRFELPAATPLGCGVPVQVRTGGTASSNIVTVPVSAGGRPCSDPAHWLLDVSGAAGRLGLITLVRAQFLEAADPVAPEAFTYDLGFASFTRQKPDRAPETALPSVGGCITFTAMIPVVRALAPPLPVKGSTGSAPVLPMEPVKPRKLDAGTILRVASAAGSRPLEPDPRRPRYYSGKFGGSMFPTFYRPGHLSVRGPGGEDVGRFDARVQVPADLRWTNREEIGTVARRDGAWLRWMPADDSQVIFIVAAGLDPRSGATAGCLCLASAAAHEFQIPSRILSTFPQTRANRDFQSSFILMAALPGSPPRPFRAKGLDAGYAFYVSTVARTVSFQ